MSEAKHVNGNVTNIQRLRKNEISKNKG